MTEIGATGTDILQGIINEEYNTDLQFPYSATVYDKMRKGDATVKSALNVCKLPIQNGKYVVEPASEEAKDVEIAEFIHYAMFEHIVWGDFLFHCMLMFDFGFTCFEKVPEIFEGKLLYKKLAPRLPKSLQRWLTDKNPNEPGMQQIIYNDTKTGTFDIPSEKLFRLTLEQEGDNFNGVSLLRSTYKDWWMKQRIEKIEMIAAQRAGSPMPKAKRTEEGTTTPEEKAALDSLLQGLNANEKANVALPFGWDIEWLALDTKFQFETSINRHDRQITKSVLAQFLETGNTGTSGGYAQTKADQDMFTKSIMAYVNYMLGRWNKFLVKELVDWNFEGVKKYPKIVVNGIRSEDIDKLAKSVQQLSQAGLGFDDFETQNDIRKRLKLPMLDEKEFEAKKKEDANEKKALEKKKVEKKVEKKLSDEKKPLYVMRKVKNTEIIKKFAKKNKIAEPIKDLHVTVAFSTDSVDWSELITDKNDLTLSVKNAKVEKLGDAFVIYLNSKELKKRWNYYKSKGASWDFDDYNPHISLSYNTDDQPKKFGKFSGEIVLGSEVLQNLELCEEKKKTKNLDEKSVATQRELEFVNNITKNEKIITKEYSLLEKDVETLNNSLEKFLTENYKKSKTIEKHGEIVLSRSGNSKLIKEMTDRVTADWEIFNKKWNNPQIAKRLADEGFERGKKSTEKLSAVSWASRGFRFNISKVIKQAPINVNERINDHFGTEAVLAVAIASIASMVKSATNDNRMKLSFETYPRSAFKQAVADDNSSVEKFKMVLPNGEVERLVQERPEGFSIENVFKILTIEQWATKRDDENGNPLIFPIHHNSKDYYLPILPGDEEEEEEISKQQRSLLEDAKDLSEGTKTITELWNRGRAEKFGANRPKATYEERGMLMKISEEFEDGSISILETVEKTHLI